MNIRNFIPQDDLTSIGSGSAFPISKMYISYNVDLLFQYSTFLILYFSIVFALFAIQNP